jgi:hypothetical protein
MSFGRPWCDDSANTHFGFCLSFAVAADRQTTQFGFCPFFAVAADRKTTHFSKLGDLATRETKIDTETERQRKTAALEGKRHRQAEFY